VNERCCLSHDLLPVGEQRQFGQIFGGSSRKVAGTDESMAAENSDFGVEIRPGTKLDAFSVKRLKKARGCFSGFDCPVGRIADENVIPPETDVAVSGHVCYGNKAALRSFCTRTHLFPNVPG
jgi:hypothetical protein